MKTKLLLLFAILNISIASAQTFTVDGVKFTVIPITTNVEVVQKTPAYTGVVAIPSSVIYNSVTYAVTAVGPEAFFYCTDLTSIAIPTSVTSIEYTAFSGCTSLTSVTIPDSVTSIGQAAFHSCTSLTSITIPDSVTSIGEAAFSACFGLTDITISNAVTLIDVDTFNHCTSLTSITIPNSVTVIGTGAFNGCSGLTSVTIPNSVTTIGAIAFYDCTSLTSVTIPNSVTTIGSVAFYNCTSLTTVNCAVVTPLVINADVFGNVNQPLCALNVPAGSVNAYKAAAVWKDFGSVNTLNTENFTNKNNIKLYPNPVQNELFLELNNASKTNLEVVDINGKVVFAKTVNNMTNNIYTSNLATGLYLLKVKAEDGNLQTIKFIKN